MTDSGKRREGSAPDWDGCPRRALIGVLGESPAVVVETLWGLRCQRRLKDPTELRLITTLIVGQDGRGLKAAKLLLLLKQLTSWVQAAKGLWKEGFVVPSVTIHLMTGSEPWTKEISLTFNADGAWVDSIGVGATEALGAIVKEDQEARKHGTGALLSDIVSDGDNQAAAEAIGRVVRELASGGDSIALHASIAGGRKTMSSQLQTVMALWGRLQDAVSHVIVSTDFENDLKDAEKLEAYPTEEGGKVPAESSQKVFLADVPVVMLSGLEASADVVAKLGVPRAVERMRFAATAEPYCRIDLANRTLNFARAGSAMRGSPEPLVLGAPAIALYATLAHIRLVGKFSLTEKSGSDEGHFFFLASALAYALGGLGASKPVEFLMSATAKESHRSILAHLLENFAQDLWWKNSIPQTYAQPLSDNLKETFLLGNSPFLVQGGKKGYRLHERFGGLSNIDFAEREAVVRAAKEIKAQWEAWKSERQLSDSKRYPWLLARRAS